MKNKRWLVIGLVICLAGGILVYKYTRKQGDRLFVKRQKEWAIGIYSGKDPFTLTPAPGVKNPVLTGKDVTDVRAQFVADPFMLQLNNTWYLFFEVLAAETKKGCIGYATSPDGLTWTYQHIVLDEPFHLSYPYVFAWKDQVYMIPESRHASAVRLYRAAQFPAKWEFVKELVHGDYADPSIVYYNSKWWLFAVRGAGDLALLYADELTGPWFEHPKSPLAVHDRHISRAGGRVIVYNGAPVRFVQDDSGHYGGSERAFIIDALTTTEYREHEAADHAILKASGSGWNCDGMHTIDAHEQPGGGWMACVDGLHVH